ncbi:MAG: AI-2E family transporter [Firmicutes bacterium]|nr:AI-2E family transporter [Bacillota bacterium]
MKSHWKTCLQAGISIFILFLCIHYWDSFAHLMGLLFTAAAPLLTGCVFAYIFNIPMSFFERHYFPKSQKTAVVKSRRPVCMLLAFLSIIAVVLLLLRIVIPELSSCVTLLLTSVPAALEKIGDSLAKAPWLSEYIQEFFNDINWHQTLSKIVGSVLGGLGSAGDYAVTFVSRTVSTAANTMVAFIFSIYILSGRETLGRQLGKLSSRYLKPGFIEKFSHVKDIANDSFHRYIVGQCTEAVILGALCTLGMLLFRFPYAAVVGVTVGFTALIPVAGAYIGGAVGFLLILTSSPLKAVLFIVYLVILQQLEGNIIYPKVVGTSLGLPGIWVLAAVIIGGGIGGIGGMLIGVPLSACLYRLVREDVQKGAA